MSLKVLHIITKLELGGAQKNVLSVLSKLDRHKYELHLISSDGLLASEAKSIPGLKVKLIPQLRRMPAPLSDIAVFVQIFFYIRTKKIQIVHTHSSKAGILGRWAAYFAGAAVIIHTVHGWGFHNYLKSFLNSFYIFLERKTAGITNRLIAVSQADIQKGVAHSIGAAEDYTLIRCAIRTPEAKEPGVYLAQRHSLGFTQEDRLIGMVACLKPQKNPIDFIAISSMVLREHPEAKFLLIGDGQMRPQVSRQIESDNLEDSISMLGWRKDMENIFPILDVVVLTSLWEGLPLVLLEAMSWSKPVIAYDVCGVGEVVKDGVNGFLVRCRDKEEFAQRLGLLLGNDSLRKRMGEFGRHIASDEVFSEPVMIRCIEDIYMKELERVS